MTVWADLALAAFLVSMFAVGFWTGRTTAHDDTPPPPPPVKDWDEWGDENWWVNPGTNGHDPAPWGWRR